MQHGKIFKAIMLQKIRQYLILFAEPKSSDAQKLFGRFNWIYFRVLGWALSTLLDIPLVGFRECRGSRPETTNQAAQKNLLMRRYKAINCYPPFVTDFNISKNARMLHGQIKFWFKLIIRIVSWEIKANECIVEKVWSGNDRKYNYQNTNETVLLILNQQGAILSLFILW